MVTKLNYSIYKEVMLTFNGSMYCMLGIPFPMGPKKTNCQKKQAIGINILFINLLKFFLITYNSTFKSELTLLTHSITFNFNLILRVNYLQEL